MAENGVFWTKKSNKWNFDSQRVQNCLFTETYFFTISILWYCDIVMECDISYINQICPFSIHNCFAWTLLITLKGWVVSSWRKISAQKWNWGWVVWHQWKKSANIIGNGVGGCFLCGCRFFQHMFRNFFPDPPVFWSFFLGPKMALFGTKSPFLVIFLDFFAIFCLNLAKKCIKWSLSEKAI